MRAAGWLVLACAATACGEVKGHEPVVPDAAPVVEEVPDAPPVVVVPPSFRSILHPLARVHGTPASTSIDTAGGRVLFFFSGSASPGNTKPDGSTVPTAGAMQLALRVDTKVVGVVRTYSNETGSTKMLGANVLMATLPAGRHTLTVEASANTLLGDKSWIDLVAIELGDAVRVSEIVQDLSGAPGTAPFITGGRPGLLLLNSSGFRTGHGPLAVDASLDSKAIGTLRAYTNESGSHKTLVPSQLVLTPAEGQHELALLAQTGTNANVSDSTSAVWLEPDSDLTLATAVPPSAGPLPLVGKVDDGPGKLLVIASGSAWRANAGALEVIVEVDGVAIGSMHGYSDEPNSHKTLLRGVFVTDLADRPHSLKLTAATASGTTVTADDSFSVVTLRSK